MVAEQQQPPTPAPIKGLAVGRIVHYVLIGGPHEGDHRPAIVVRCWNEYDPGMVNLQVFTDGANDGQAESFIWQTSIHHDPDEKKPGTWHFPEYVP